MVMVVLMLLLYRCSLPNALFGPKILKPSPVDISILETIKDYQMNDIEDLKNRIEPLKSNGGLLMRLDSAAWNADPGSEWRFSFTSFSSDGVSILIFDTQENARNILTSEIGYLQDISYESAEISHDVEAFLLPVHWSRSADSLFMFTNPKMLVTKIRVGNVILDFFETSNDLDTIGVLTNEALRQIVEALEP